MKKKHYILTALVLALTACTNDDVVQTTSSDEIKFDVVTNSLSRAAAIHTTTDDLQQENDAQFYISAYSNSGGSSTYGFAPYFIKETLHYDDASGKWIFTNDKKYVWPEGKLNFYAIHKCIGTDIDDDNIVMRYGSYGSKNENYGFKWGSKYFSLEFGEVSVANRIDQQGDMLYAVREAIEKGTTGTVTLNFRHALSAIYFQIENASDNLYVEVQNITINKIKNTGNFYINGSTYSQNTNTSAEYAENTRCKWMPIAGTQNYSLFANRPNGVSDTTSDGEGGEDGGEDVDEVIDENGEEVEEGGSTAITIDNDSYEYAFPRVGVTPLPENAKIAYDSKKHRFMLLPQSFDNDGDLVVTLRCRIYNIKDVTKFNQEVAKIDASKTDAEKAAAIHDILKGKNAAGTIDFSTACGSLLCGTSGTKQDDGTYTDDGFANLNIPVNATKWVPGNKYLYRLIFGTDGGSTLIPIKISEEVTNWDTNEIDKEFKYEPATE